MVERPTAAPASQIRAAQVQEKKLRAMKIGVATGVVLIDGVAVARVAG
jgi:hypothetical protein